MVRELFVMAREHAPSIIFMDEIDSIGSSRLEGGSGGDSEVQRTMLELLNQLDGFEATKNIKVTPIFKFLCTVFATSITFPMKTLRLLYCQYLPVYACFIRVKLVTTLIYTCLLTTFPIIYCL